jgi:hypothetical protein
VLIGDTHQVQGPENFIPSFVRLHRSKEWVDFMGNIWGSTLQVVLEARGVSTKGKVSISGPGFPSTYGKSIAGMVQRGAEIANSVPNDETKY